MASEIPFDLELFQCTGLISFSCITSLRESIKKLHLFLRSVGLFCNYLPALSACKGFAPTSSVHPNIIKNADVI